MTVKELIKKLSNVNPNSIVIFEENWYTYYAAKHSIDDDTIEANKRSLLNDSVTEVEESDDGAYVRLWYWYYGKVRLK